MNKILTATAIVLFLVTAGCSNNALNPNFQPQVTNNTDSFGFQTTGITNITQTLNYDWQNTGTLANINQSCSVSGGTATLVIRDNGGTQVYTKDLATNGNFPTSAGTSGTWKIQIILNNCSGTLNFTAQKG